MATYCAASWAAAEGSSDGAVVGCRWAEGRWQQKGALEFKGTENRVRIFIPGEYESITLACWMRIEGFDRYLSAIMLTDGHDLGEVHWQFTETGQLLLGVKADMQLLARLSFWCRIAALGRGTVGAFGLCLRSRKRHRRSLCRWASGEHRSNSQGHYVAIRRSRTWELGAGDLQGLPRSKFERTHRRICCVQNGAFRETDLQDVRSGATQLVEQYEVAKLITFGGSLLC